MEEWVKTVTRSELRVIEKRNNGRMEYWNDGVLKKGYEFRVMENIAGSRQEAVGSNE